MLLLFPSGAQVIVMLQVAVLVLFQCMSNQRPSTLLHFFTHRLHICSFSVVAPQYWYGPVTGSVGFFGDTCYQTHPLLCHPPCSFSMCHTRNSRTGTTSGLYSFGPIRMIFERQILFNLTNALAFESLFFGSFITTPSCIQTVAPK